ncbi:Protein of unknown function, partial [Cotesia congregata]
MQINYLEPPVLLVLNEILKLRETKRIEERASFEFIDLNTLMNIELHDRSRAIIMGTGCLRAGATFSQFGFV